MPASLRHLVLVLGDQLDPGPVACDGSDRSAITWRRKWARVWEEVRSCSDACRKQRGRKA